MEARRTLPRAAAVGLASLFIAPTFGLAARIAPSLAVPADATVRTLRVTAIKLAMPSGLVYGKDGTLYVADAVEHAIFAIDKSGRGRVFAGKPAPPMAIANGGYADGPAASARFNRPKGLAMTAAGDILVADDSNHCIRRIHSGVVTTLAGRCGIAGTATGPAASALFSRPLGIAVARDGTIFVADYVAGLRRIDATGNVSDPIAGTPSAHLTGVTGVNTVGDTLLVADTTGIWRLPQSFGYVLGHYRAGMFGERKDIDVAGVFEAEFGGFPYALIGLDTHDVVAVDPRMHDIDFLHNNHMRVIAGSTDVGAPARGGGFADGTGRFARFNTPLAIVASPAGGYVVADAGNHAIRFLSTFDREPEDPPPADVRDYGFTPNDYSIALIGNSYVWVTTTTPESIQSAIEQGLLADRSLRRAAACRVASRTRTGD